jgi:hypothetical protein
MRTTMKKGALLLAAAVSLFVVRDVRASAPVDQYDPFMPGDTWIHDAKTGLFWERPLASPDPMTQAAAASLCSSLDEDAGAKWRLPTYKELMTLVDEDPHDEYESGTLVPKAIDREAFPGTPAKKFWSSTQSSDSPGTTFYAVDFGTGMPSKDDPGDPRFVRCVSDAKPI